MAGAIEHYDDPTGRRRRHRQKNQLSLQYQKDKEIKEDYIRRRQHALLERRLGFREYSTVWSLIASQCIIIIISSFVLQPMHYTSSSHTHMK